MKVLVACEFSGVVRDAFRRRGHDAWSCDLKPAMDESPYHFRENATEVAGRGWDLMIAHPPCTYLSTMSNCRIKEPGRLEARAQGLAFLKHLADTSIDRICIENPRGYPERAWRPADQIIQPWEFGHPHSKATCLWLKNLPPLFSTLFVAPERWWDGKRWRTWVDGFGSGKSYLRSITFAGVAEAMADQWGNI